MNKILTNKDKIFAQNQKNLENQDSKVYQMKQQIKELQQHINNKRNSHKIEIENINKKL